MIEAGECGNGYPGGLAPKMFIGVIGLIGLTGLSGSSFSLGGRWASDIRGDPLPSGILRGLPPEILLRV
jgi:hypothetical protein